ncbi:hypothetical protein [Chitinophaga rhizosphaerae]|uniref:hypothetical protein n=1 Tax=Chitinophaga rhizosphaerae TaxID=1864947 RepID=UPI0013DED14B|nr:hypothetical protein [Chitinophaga rhizosphaerae]
MTNLLMPGAANARGKHASYENSGCGCGGEGIWNIERHIHLSLKNFQLQPLATEFFTALNGGPATHKQVGKMKTGCPGWNSLLNERHICPASQRGI